MVKFLSILQPAVLASLHSKRPVRLSPMLIITIKREDIPMKALWIAPVAVLGFFGFSPTGDTRAGDERPIICGAALDGFGQSPLSSPRGWRPSKCGSITMEPSLTN